LKRKESKCELSVALCTHNGSNYIEQQLCSLAEQSMLPAELVVCDDNSQDDTVEKIRRFSAMAPFKVRIYSNIPGLGVVKNFARAVSLCSCEYIALCDQDDIWLPNKIETTMKKMFEVEASEGKDTPILVHSDLKVVAQNCQQIAASFMEYQSIKHLNEQVINSLLVQNFVTGCTVILNRALINRAMPLPQHVIMHDWWFALIAAVWGRIAFVRESTLLYRQHNLNVVGAKGFFSINNIMKVFNLRKLDQGVANLFLQAVVLSKHLDNQEPDATKKVIDEYLQAGRIGGLYAIKVFLINKIYKQGFIRNILYYFTILRGSYKKYFNNEWLV